MMNVTNKTKKLQIAVIGSAGLSEYTGCSETFKSEYNQQIKTAESLGLKLAQKGVVVICGGKGGVMEAVANGVRKNNGTIIGVVSERFSSNKFIDIEIVSGTMIKGFDEYLLVSMCDGLICLGGGAGTLQELSIAYRNKKPIVVLDNFTGWGNKLSKGYLDERKNIQIVIAKTPDDAINKIIDLISK